MIHMIQFVGKLCVLTTFTKVKRSNAHWNQFNNRIHHVLRVLGQGRLDGAFCDFTENDKMEYLQKLRDFGVINIEMECTIFAALTYHAGIRSAIVCVALLDRLKGDQASL